MKRSDVQRSVIPAYLAGFREVSKDDAVWRTILHLHADTADTPGRDRWTRRDLSLIHI